MRKSKKEIIQMDVLQFTNFIKGLGLSNKKQDKIINEYISLKRQEEINKKIRKSVTLDQYCNQIITMIKQNPDLSNQVYADYIKFSIEKILNSKDLEIEVKK